MNGIRIIELPRCKAVTYFYPPGDPAGDEGLDSFTDWWIEFDNTRADRCFQRDFSMVDENDATNIFYLLSDDAEIDCEYKVVDFEGGLYAALASDINSFDIDGAVKIINDWVNSSGVFELDERAGHYVLNQTITPQILNERFGFLQFEAYVPIKLKSE